jgi:hypothetical protein
MWRIRIGHVPPKLRRSFMIDPPHQGTAAQRHITPFDQQRIMRVAILICEPQPPSVAGIRESSASLWDRGRNIADGLTRQSAGQGGPLVVELPPTDCLAGHCISPGQSVSRSIFIDSYHGGLGL